MDTSRLNRAVAGDVFQCVCVRVFLKCVFAQYLLQYGVDSVHFTVDEEALFLPAVHLLDDASVLCGVHDAPD